MAFVNRKGREIPTNKPRVIVTCGPSFEPLDEVRSITNFSTGELGVRIADALTAAGFETTCLLGERATWPHRPASAETLDFSTNDDLENKLRILSAAGEFAGVFHAAALCDYRLLSVENSSGDAIHSGKISSRQGVVTIQLEPLPKLIASLRAWFPKSWIVGWKYEVDGTRIETIEKGRRQIEENDLDGCVVNGRAFGAGFGFCTPGAAELQFVEDKPAIAFFLANWLQTRPDSER